MMIIQQKPVSLDTRYLIAVVISALLYTCNRIPAIPENPPEGKENPAGNTYSSLPDTVDPEAHYLFYIHGAIIEDQGIYAVSPEFGPYEYTEILEYLANAGFNVIGEIRGPTPDPDLYSDKIIESIQQLKNHGVKSRNITIMGFSKGAGLTIHTASKLQDQEINYILIAICDKLTDQDPILYLSGRVLSIYESSDPLGTSCQNLVNRSPAVTSFHEIELTTGKKHGAFYTADSLWLDQVIIWLDDIDN